ncbi:MAG: cob(I)yrinic acid a,c-diamide adenosyltransferase [Patescibacteria group bacterium]|nr:cob(I)yrinic acid a,c-diamide adenosyltransferase [Patescibacteria group bacterium]
MPIYTKKGDKGTTKIIRQTKSKISKDSLIIEVLGELDMLTSYLGVVKSVSESEDLNNRIAKIQIRLFTIGSITAGAKLPFPKEFTTDLEMQIDQMEKILPKLANFVIPGGSVVASHLHYARTLARLLERRMVALSSYMKIKSTVLMFLNRLSDYLFTLARNENFRVGIDEQIWVFEKR